MVTKSLLTYSDVYSVCEIVPKCHGTVENGESQLSKYFHMATRIHPLPEESYSRPSCDDAVFTKLRRRKANIQRLNRFFSKWRIYLGGLKNPHSKPMVHMNSRILRKQMAYEPIVGHRRP